MERYRLRKTTSCSSRSASIIIPELIFKIRQAAGTGMAARSTRVELPVPRVRQEQKVRQAPLVQQVQLERPDLSARPALRGHRAMPVQLVRQAHKVRPACKVPVVPKDRRVPPEFLTLRVQQDQQDHRATLALLALRDQKAIRVTLDRRVPLVLQAMSVRRVPPARPVRKARRLMLVRKEIPATKAQLVRLVRKEPLVQLALTVLLVPSAQQVKLEPPVLSVLRVLRATLEQLVRLAHRDRKVIKVRRDLLALSAPLDQRATPVRRELSVQLGPRVQRAQSAPLVRKEIPARQAFPVLTVLRARQDQRGRKGIQAQASTRIGVSLKKSHGRTTALSAWARRRHSCKADFKSTSVSQSTQRNRPRRHACSKCGFNPIRQEPLVLPTHRCRSCRSSAPSKPPRKH
jgi:hypothetical protein